MATFIHHCIAGDHDFGRQFYRDSILSVVSDPFLGECPQHGAVWVRADLVVSEERRRTLEAIRRDAENFNRRRS